MKKHEVKVEGKVDVNLPKVGGNGGGVHTNSKKSDCEEANAGKAGYCDDDGVFHPSGEGDDH